MSLHTKTNATGSITYHSVTGTFNRSQMLDCFGSPVRDDGHPNDVVVDLSRLRHLDITEAGLEEIGDHLRNEFPLRFCAIVVGDRYEPQLRWFADHAANAYQCVQAFDNLPSAQRWLRVAY